MISFEQKGNYNKAFRFLSSLSKSDISKDLLKDVGERGVEALKANTPVRTGKTANSWYYTIENNSSDGTTSVVWRNSNFSDNVNVALVLATGHASKSGYWIEGIDYVNPALKPLFDSIGNEIVKKGLPR